LLTNYNGKDLTQLVGSVYDCIANETLWDDTLDEIRDVCQGHLATLGVIDSETHTTRFSIASGDKEAIAPIANIHASSYSFLPAVPKLELDQPYKISTIYSVQGPDARDQWLESKLNKEWAVPNQIDDCIWVPMVKTATRSGHLVIMTHLSRGPVSDEDLAMMGQLAPHIRRAVTIGDLFEAERGKGEIFREIVDVLQTPVFIVTADMQILFANFSGERMLAENQLVQSLRGRLDFSFQLASNAIEYAVMTARRDEFVLGQNGINVPLSRLNAPAVAHVMPLTRRDSHHRVLNNAAAAVFISASGQSAMPAMDAIGALFGLTPAEKSVAAHIAAGLKPKEMAIANGTTENTIRTQLAHLYDKTQTSDQGEVLALIRDLTPPVRSS
jgi:DNA-binding CsgD family transcriptional regulator